MLLMQGFCVKENYDLPRVSYRKLWKRYKRARRIDQKN